MCVSRCPHMNSNTNKPGFHGTYVAQPIDGEPGNIGSRVMWPQH